MFREYAADGSLVGSLLSRQCVGQTKTKVIHRWSRLYHLSLYQLLYHFGSAIADVYVCIILVCIILVQLRRYLFHLFEFRLDQFVRINFMCNAHCASILDSTIEVVYFRLHITLYLIVSVCCCRTVHLNCSTELCSQTPQPNSAAKLALSSNIK